MVRAPTIAGNIPGADFFLGHAPGAVAIRAEVAFVLVKDYAIGQRHFGRRAQRKLPLSCGAWQVKQPISEGLDDKFLDIDLTGLGALNEPFVGVATLAIIGVGIARVAEGSMARGLILAAHPAHGKLRLRAMAIDTAFGKNAVLRF